MPLKEQLVEEQEDVKQVSAIDWAGPSCRRSFELATTERLCSCFEHRQDEE